MEYGCDGPGIVCEQALRHRAIEQCADNPAVQLFGETDHPWLGFKFCADTTLVIGFAAQVQAVRVRGVANDAAGVERLAILIERTLSVGLSVGSVCARVHDRHRR